MKRTHYLDGWPVQLVNNGCDGCAITTVQGQIVHEHGCHMAWHDSQTMANTRRRYADEDTH